jgi:hypothetical protein
MRAHYFTILHLVKEKLISVIILLGVIFATIAFYDKTSNTEDAIDRLKVGLEGVVATTPPGTNLSFAFIGDTAYGTIAMPYIRYILAPRFISGNIFEYDTMLIMCHEGIYDKVKQKIEYNRRILTKQNYKKYYFLITCSK